MSAPAFSHPLVAKILSEIERDECAARDAIGWDNGSRWEGQPIGWVRYVRRYPPYRVFLRCKADRKILAQHTRAEDYPWLCRVCREEGQNLDCTYPCDLIRLLAEGYGIDEFEYRA